MQSWQYLFLTVFLVFNVAVFCKGIYESKYKHNAFGLTRLLSIIGVFVWGDAVVFGLFWMAAAAVALGTQNWLLFLLTGAVFWVVRSVGETLYWLNQQFSSINRNPPESLPGFSLFKNDSIWFVYQIMWQCVTVVSLLLSVYLGWLWLSGLGQN